MKNIIKLFAFALVIAGFSTTSYGQNAATATATGTISTSIKIENKGDLNFGNILADPTTAGTVVIDPASVATYTTVSAAAIPGTITAAHFLVSGEINTAYTISAIAPTAVVSGSNSMDVTAFTVDPGFGVDGGLLNSTGIQNVYVGATLNVKAGQAAGVYTSTTPFTVTVNY